MALFQNEIIILLLFLGKLKLDFTEYFLEFQDLFKKKKKFYSVCLNYHIEDALDKDVLSLIYPVVAVLPESTK